MSVYFNANCLLISIYVSREDQDSLAVCLTPLVSATKHCQSLSVIRRAAFIAVFVSKNFAG